MSTLLRLVLLILAAAALTAAARPSIGRADSGIVMERTASVPILMYHRIRPLPPDGMVKSIMTFSVHPSDFEAQMRWLLARGYTPIALAELDDYLRCGEPLPEKPIVITFDDGWADQFGNALPVLRTLDIPAEFFICPGRIGQEGYMTWEQVRALAAAGMGVNAHSLTHPHLDEIPLDAAQREIEQSRLIIEEEIDRPAPYFAYPYGETTPEVIELVRRAGYTLALGTEEGATQRTSERFSLRRIILTYDGGVEQLASKLGG